MYGVRYAQKQTSTISIDKNAGMIHILRVPFHTLRARNLSTVLMLHNAYHHPNYDYLCYVVVTVAVIVFNRGRDVDFILEREKKADSVSNGKQMCAYPNEWMI